MGSVLLPWLVDDGGAYLGIDQPDGRLTVIVGIGALILAWYQIRIGWTAAGFLAAVLIRDLYLASQLGSVSAGYGLWLGAVAFTVAAALQVVRLVRNIRSAVVDDS